MDIMLQSHLMGKKLLGRFIKNIYKTQIKQNLELLKKKKR